MPSSPFPAIVAHRGYASNYPENTLTALEAALNAGVQHLEFDVQLSADEMPVLFHDARLERTTSGQGLIYEHDWQQLQKLSAGEPKRFGSDFENVTIPSLQQCVKFLESWPQVTVFLELKEESLKQFGNRCVVTRVLDAISAISQRCVIISYNPSVLADVRMQSASQVGWVISNWNNSSKHLAQRLNPEFLIVNHKKIPQQANSLWRGPWKWMTYEITSAELAYKLQAMGIGFVETMQVEKLVNDMNLEAHSNPC